MLLILKKSIPAEIETSGGHGGTIGRLGDMPNLILEIPIFLLISLCARFLPAEYSPNDLFKPG
jgi:hypothetical protein